ncbi:MAG: ribosome maturation factor RimP [Myxococcota bacterium]|nr:ribosome maturation factor RimP [Myxococcota bacterium]
MYRDIPEDLRSLIEPVLHDFGCELVDAVVRRSSKDGLLRVVIDDRDGSGRVSIENLETASREIEVQLDAADYMTGRYRLEVSSPGLDRILAREKDFTAAIGNQVQIQTRTAMDGRRKFKGTLLDFSAGAACVEIDGQHTSIPFEAIEKANTIYQFSRDDFAGSPNEVPE